MPKCKLHYTYILLLYSLRYSLECVPGTHKVLVQSIVLCKEKRSGGAEGGGGTVKEGQREKGGVTILIEKISGCYI